MGNTKGAAMIEPKMGDFVRDKITSFDGVVTSISYFWHSTPRARVTSRKLKDNRPVGDEHFDLSMLEVIIAGAVKPIEPENAECKFKFGDKAKSVGGLEGVVTGHGLVNTGCRSVRIQPVTKDRDGRPHSDEVFNEGELELVTAVQEKAAPKQSGGDWSPVEPRDKTIELRRDAVRR